MSDSRQPPDWTAMAGGREAPGPAMQAMDVFLTVLANAVAEDERARRAGRLQRLAPIRVRLDRRLARAVRDGRSHDYATRVGISALAGRLDELLDRAASEGPRSGD